MPITLREILEAKGVRLQDTIYCRAADTIPDFPMNIGNFFKLTGGGRSIGDFELLNRLYSFVENKKKNVEYQIVGTELQQIKARLKEMKSVKSPTGDFIAEKLSLRNRKKSLDVKKTALEEQYFAQSVEEIKKEGDFGPQFLEYKNTFNCSSFSEITAILPLVKTLDTPKLKEMPLFVRGLHDLSQILKRGLPLGIVGGPCLFGAYEVTIDIHCQDGGAVQFDFSTGHKYAENNTLTEHSIESFLSTWHQNVNWLELKNNKLGVTCQEYLSMQYLFEFATVLGAKVVIPIPDMSYMKFFKGVMRPVANKVKEPAIKTFEKISQDIADLYLTVIEDLRTRYPKVECQVLHSRDPDLCNLFYDKRKRYINMLDRMGKVTADKEKTDAIVDYITMLALPFYVYGIRNVLQIDSVDEADSMRKCMKIHGPAVSFHSILFPEYLSGDGIHTVYYAPREFKDYI